MGVCEFCNGRGKVFSHKKNRMVHCPVCGRKKQEEIVTGVDEQGVPLTQKLGIITEGITEDFSYQAAVPTMMYVGDKYKEAMAEKQKEAMACILGALENKEVPTHSYCFGIGSKGRPDLFMYPILVRSYKNSWDTPPALTSMSLRKLFLEDAKEYARYVSANIVVVKIGVYPTWSDLGLAKTLMQDRAMAGKPTIFVTTFYERGCVTLLSDIEPSNWLAESLFLDKTNPDAFIEEIKRGSHRSEDNFLIGEPGAKNKSGGFSMSNL